MKVSCQPQASAALPKETGLQDPFSEYWARWASEPDWTFQGRGKFPVRAGNGTTIPQLLNRSVLTIPTELYGRIRRHEMKA
jgi:hypothetical protein